MDILHEECAHAAAWHIHKQSMVAVITGMERFTITNPTASSSTSSGLIVRGLHCGLTNLLIGNQQEKKR
jgi:Na+-translocating ferredoxin:NAD+ oxidoreductase RnfD subunit